MGKHKLFGGIAADSFSVGDIVQWSSWNMQKQNWDKSLLYFNKSKDLNNKFPKTFFNIAIILNLLNKKKESILFFKSYIELQPNDIEAYYSLGICYREIGDIQMAEKTFLKAFKNDSLSEISTLTNLNF